MGLDGQLSIDIANRSFFSPTEEGFCEEFATEDKRILEYLSKIRQ